MKLIYLDNSYREQLNQFVNANSYDGGFLQSWEWGDFKKQRGNNILRLAVVDDANNFLAVATVIEIKSYYFLKKFYIPRGPIVDYRLGDNIERFKDVVKIIFDELDAKATREKVLFTRVEPDWLRTKYPKDILAQMGFVPGKRNIQILHTLVLRLEKGLDTILASMKQKTRYNIRLAKRKGVEIKIYPAKEKIDVFLGLLKKTAKWHNFKTRSDAYYQQMVKNDSDDFKTYVALAVYNGVPIAGNLLIEFRDNAYYLMGASDRSYKNLMAPYLVHWEVMNFLVNEGVKYYDLWGVQSRKEIEDKREANWSGVSDFKWGFAPSEPITEYYGIWEKSYKSIWYKIYSLFK